MTTIPPEIESLITRVDRLGDKSLLPKAGASIHRYDAEIEALFPDGRVVNITEFDYGRAYRYQIVLSRDPDAANLDDDALSRALSRLKRIEVLNVALSVLAKYSLIRYLTYTRQGGEIEETWTDAPVTAGQREAANRVLGWLSENRFQLVSNDVASCVVENVATELCDEGDATVADCLFFG